MCLTVVASVCSDGQNTTKTDLPRQGNYSFQLLPVKSITGQGNRAASRDWRIGQIHTKFPLPSPVLKAIQIDLNADGKADILVLTGIGISSKQSTEGIYPRLFVIENGKARCIWKYAHPVPVGNLKIANLNGDPYPDVILELEGGSWMPRVILNFVGKTFKAREIYFGDRFELGTMGQNGARELIVREDTARHWEDRWPDELKVHPFVQVVYRWNRRKYVVGKVLPDSSKEQRLSLTELVERLLELKSAQEARELSTSEVKQTAEQAQLRYMQFRKRTLTPAEQEAVNKVVNSYQAHNR